MGRYPTTLLAAVLAASPALVLGVRLGPQNCVTLSLSGAGTCVIKNACEGVDTSKYEYALDCWNSPQDLVRHSFGVGGFAADEEFDTDIPCKRCEPPADLQKLAAQAPKPVKAARPQSLVAAKTTARARQEAVAQFGPGKCVSTWRQKKSSHCIMMTNCTNEEMGDYEYGLICVDKDGEPMKHLFGKNSFDPEEIFDTLLVCAECDGLDESKAGKLNETTVAELEKDVKEMADMLKSASKAIVKLNEKVFNTTTKLPELPKALLHKKSKHQKLAPSHHHREMPAPLPAAGADEEDVDQQDAREDADQQDSGSEGDGADAGGDGADDQQ